MQRVPVFLWPCNVEHWILWQTLPPLWSVGVAGAVGLDMAGLCAWLRSARGMRGAKLADAMRAISACASGHLAGIADRAAAIEAQKQERELADQLASFAARR